jgi:hypothetical protein
VVEAAAAAAAAAAGGGRCFRPTCFLKSEKWKEKKKKSGDGLGGGPSYSQEVLVVQVRRLLSYRLLPRIQNSDVQVDLFMILSCYRTTIGKYHIENCLELR